MAILVICCWMLVVLISSLRNRSKPEKAGYNRVKVMGSGDYLL
jgi:hypothetical protein